MQATLERLKARRAEMRDEKGFTLIELLIVVVILGILAAIVVFAVVGVTGSSAQGACRSDWKTVESAVGAYKAQMGSFATNFSQLANATTDSNNATVGPWLNSADLSSAGAGSSVLKNSNHYQIMVAGTLTAVNGTVATSTAIVAGNVQVANANGSSFLPLTGGTATASDCSAVS